MARLLTAALVATSLVVVVAVGSTPALAAQKAVLVKDISPGPSSSFSGGDFGPLTDLNGKLVFGADDGIHGCEPWQSDGTLEGTTLVKDIVPGPDPPTTRYPCDRFVGEALTNLDGNIFFGASDENRSGRDLWKTDGTTEGTTLVKDFPRNGGLTSGVTNVAGTLFFTARDRVHGIELWKSDGTTEGTTLVKDIYPGEPWSEPWDLTDVDGILFFSADDGVHDRELWKSDGTAKGTVMVKDINPFIVPYGSSTAEYLTNVNGTLFFNAWDGHRRSLWKSDGTAGGTRLVKDVDPYLITDVNGTLFFNGDGGGNQGYELWKSDGTTEGTTLVKDINPAYNSEPDYGPRVLTNVDGKLFFIADDGIHGFEPWQSDGTAEGTTLIKDINPGRAASWGDSSEEFGLPAQVEGTFFFSASDGVHGHELWQSDGTNKGTTLVTDINQGADSSIPHDLTSIDGTLFFNADDGVHGRELWKTTPPERPEPQRSDYKNASQYCTALREFLGDAEFSERYKNRGKCVTADH